LFQNGRLMILLYGQKIALYNQVKYKYKVFFFLGKIQDIVGDKITFAKELFCSNKLIISLLEWFIEVELWAKN